MEMTIQAAAQFLYREALLLDSRRWDEWLAMFTEDCEFWVPSWRDEDSITEDPKRELCLIFYAGRSGLEERVWRARSGRSVASAVLPRTSHSIHNVWTEPPGDGKAAHDAVRVHSVWTVHQFTQGQGYGYLFRTLRAHPRPVRRLLAHHQQEGGVAE